jgi:hypothetical protein
MAISFVVLAIRQTNLLTKEIIKNHFVMLLLTEDLSRFFTEVSELVELLCPPVVAAINDMDEKITSTTTPTAVIKSNVTFIYCIPQDIIRDKIVKSFLTVQRVNHSNVRVICALSHDGRYPLSSTLIDSDDENDTWSQSWWLSADGTMPRGRGAEYIEYDLRSSKCNDKTKTSSLVSAISPFLDANTFHVNINDNSTNDNTEYRSLCRLSKISLKVPPMPMGPLSVAQFHLERLSIVENNTSSNHLSVGNSANKKKWTTCTKVFRVADNTANWQEFLLDNPIDVNCVRVVCTCNQIGLLTPRIVQDHPEYSSVGFFSIRFD